MKNQALHLMLMFALLGITSISVANTNCYSISNHDRRTACLAEAKKDTTGCTSIRSHDKRNMCTANTRGQKSDCYAIRSKDDRNACLAGMPY